MNLNLTSLSGTKTNHVLECLVCAWLRGGRLKPANSKASRKESETIEVPLRVTRYVVGYFS